jgi:hypothetical protein
MRTSAPGFLSAQCGSQTSPCSSYDIFAINIASTMLGYVYGKGEHDVATKIRRSILTTLDF